jgi:hypothetical protein
LEPSYGLVCSRLAHISGEGFPTLHSGERVIDQHVFAGHFELEMLVLHDAGLTPLRKTLSYVL